MGFSFWARSMSCPQKLLSNNNMFMIYQCSCSWWWIHSSRYSVPKHSWAKEAPSCGTPRWGRSICHKPLSHWRLPGHSLHPLKPTILSRFLHHWNRWLHLRKCSCCVSKLQNSSPKTHEWTSQHGNGPRSNWPKPSHWDFNPKLWHNSKPRSWACKGLNLIIFRPSLEEVFKSGCYAILHW